MKYAWNAVEKGMVNDEGKHAFLLSFDMGEKFVPQRAEQLIECYPNWGPTFGKDDIYIANDCTKTSILLPNFPTPIIGWAATSYRLASRLLRVFQA
jgi:hypothetical protein